MPNHLSLLGIFHTVVSIIAILVAVIALIHDGKINPANVRGRLYVLLTIITCVTGLPIMKTGHPTPGHFLAILILVLLPVGAYARSIKIFGKAAYYAQVIIMSLTLFFSFVPAIVETLTRLPVANPLAADANAPIIQKALIILVALFVLGVTYQVIKLRSQKKASQSPDTEIA